LTCRRIWRTASDRVFARDASMSFHLASRGTRLEERLPPRTMSGLLRLRGSDPNEPGAILLFGDDGNRPTLEFVARLALEDSFDLVQHDNAPTTWQEMSLPASLDTLPSTPDPRHTSFRLAHQQSPPRMLSANVRYGVCDRQPNEVSASPLAWATADGSERHGKSPITAAMTSHPEAPGSRGGALRPRTAMSRRCCPRSCPSGFLATNLCGGGGPQPRQVFLSL
jgi:hypothetical protein